METHRLAALGVLTSLIIIATAFIWSGQGSTDEQGEVAGARIISTEQSTSPTPNELGASSSNIPYFPGSNITVESDSVSDGIRYLEIGSTVNGKEEMIYAWFAKTLSEQGWKIESDRMVNGVRVIESEQSATKMNLQVSKIDGNTSKVLQSIRLEN